MQLWVWRQLFWLLLLCSTLGPTYLLYLAFALGTLLGLGVPFTDRIRPVLRQDSFPLKCVLWNLEKNLISP